MPKRVLMTGHNGYIGSVMVPYFVRAGIEVIGLDTGYFSPCTLVPDRAEIPALRKDIRDLEPTDLQGFEAVVHLAALSNDPIGNLNAQWTEEINFRASVRLAEAGQSCWRRAVSVLILLHHVRYVGCGSRQRRLSAGPQDGVCALEGQERAGDRRNWQGTASRPSFFRNGTVYGVSPRMRFDTVFNDLLGAAVTTGKVVVL